MMRTEMTTEINEGQTKFPEYDVEEQTESIEKDTLTIESQTKFPEYDVKETTEGSENGPEYEDEYDGEVFYPEEIKDNSIKEVTTNHYLKNDTLTTEGQTKFPEYDVKETTEGTENGSEYEDEIDIEYGGGEVFYPEYIKENSTKVEVITNQHFKNDTLTTEGQTKFPEYDVKETTEG